MVLFDREGLLICEELVEHIERGPGPNPSGMAAVRAILSSYQRLALGQAETEFRILEIQSMFELWFSESYWSNEDIGGGKLHARLVMQVAQLPVLLDARTIM